MPAMARTNPIASASIYGSAINGAAQPCRQRRIHVHVAGYTLHDRSRIGKRPCITASGRIDVGVAKVERERMGTNAIDDQEPAQRAAARSAAHVFRAPTGDFPAVNKPELQRSPPLPQSNDKSGKATSALARSRRSLWPNGYISCDLNGFHPDVLVRAIDLGKRFCSLARPRQALSSFTREPVPASPIGRRSAF